MKAKFVRKTPGTWALVVLLLASFAAASGPQVKTASGTVEGKEDGAINKFLGIPYAAPPVGDLRWKPPVPACEVDWRAQGHGVRLALHAGKRVR